MKTQNLFITSFALLVLLLSTGCSTTQSETDPYKATRQERRKQKAQQARQLADQLAATVDIEELTDAEHAAVSDIEILWQIPELHIDGVIIRYGSNHAELTESVKIPLSEIKIVQDPEYGRVMHYIIKDIPIDKPLFATITGYEGENELATSDLASTN